MAKSSLKKSIPKPVRKIYDKFFSRSLNNHFLNAVNSVSPKTATKILHYKKTGKLLDLNNPTLFNDKLQWLKLYENNNLVTICADKYEVYNYVSKNGNPNILNKLLAVYESTDEIDWDKLPDKFAIKCNHGCGYNIVTSNKLELNKEDVFYQLNKWLKRSYGKAHLEYHYDRIKPKIIIEEYIENKAGLLPLDYKIYCFNGKPELVLVCSERENKLKLDFFDLNWERLNIGHKFNESDKELVKPSCFDEMIKNAEELSKPFAFVRIDFYDKDGVAILGEFTFTPAANTAKYYNDFGQKYLGDLLTLPNAK